MGGLKLFIVCTSLGSERWLENQNLDSAEVLDQSNIKTCSWPNTLLFREEVTSREQNLKEGTDMWQAEAHIYSSGSWRVGRLTWGEFAQEIREHCYMHESKLCLNVCTIKWKLSLWWMSWESSFLAGKGFRACLVRTFLAGCLSWFVALKGHCSESFCYQQSLGLLDRVCFYSADLTLQSWSFVIYISQTGRRSRSSWWLGKPVHPLLVSRWFWDGLESRLALLRTWIVNELGWN